MARTSDEWRDGAQERIESTLDDIYVDLNHHDSRLYSLAEELRDTALAEDPDVDAAKEAARELREAFKDLGDDGYDMAYSINQFLTSAVFRNLRGEEPLAYSTPDGGAKHDAVYGMASKNAAFARFKWPLDLDKWDRETANVESVADTRIGVQAPPGSGGIDPVTAEGTVKYTRNVGGRTVHIVVDERGVEPF